MENGTKLSKMAASVQIPSGAPYTAQKYEPIVHLNGAAYAPKKQAHPVEELKTKASEWGVSMLEQDFAERMDRDDKLAHLRHMFHYMKAGQLPGVDTSLVNPNDDCVYFCGNSLGLQPKGLKEKLDRELNKWANEGVHGHFSGVMPWAHCDEAVEGGMAKLVGAKRSEVAVMNGLTINEHLQMISFYQPTPQRYKVMLEDHAFPSDHYCIESHIRLHGYDPEKSMVLLKPREGEFTLRTEDIVERLEKEGSEIAVVLLSGVQYYTGQYFDIETITKAGHKQGCYVGWDLAHAAGNVPLHLHDWDVDFACWCSYKYMNAGNGGIGGFFIHERHFDNDFNKLHGWWSHQTSTRFKMDNVLVRESGARAYRISNPPMLLCVAVEASLDVFDQTSMEEVRDKSLLLTAYLEYLMLHYYPAMPQSSSSSDCSSTAKATSSNSASSASSTSPPPSVRIITPDDPSQRGAQLSVMFSVPVGKVFTELTKRGCVLDKREPNVLRVAPAPLYNSFLDVHRFVRLLGEAMRAAGEQ